LIQTHFNRRYFQRRMVRITVRTISPVDENMWSFHVQVTESDGSKTSHRVSMDEEYYKKISTGIIGPEDFVKKSFGFLLKREDKHSILKEFNIKQISEYFPEYETEIIRMIRES
jgi:hypothetical protein